MGEAELTFREDERYRLVHRAKVLGRWIAVQIVGTAAFLFLFVGLRMGQLVALSALPLGSLAIGTIFAAMLVVPFLQHRTSERLNALLLELRDPKDAGLLAELGNYDITVRSRAERVLARILPDLDSDESLELTPYQRHCLYQLLFEPRSNFWRSFRYYGVFPPILLSFIHRSGGSEAIPYLEQFATWAKWQSDPEARKLGDYARAAVGDVRFRTAKAIIDQRVASAAARLAGSEVRVEALQPSSAERSEIA